jgi:hypothetical protein
MRFINAFRFVTSRFRLSRAWEAAFDDNCCEVRHLLDAKGVDSNGARSGARLTTLRKEERYFADEHNYEAIMCSFAALRSKRLSFRIDHQPKESFAFGIDGSVGGVPSSLVGGIKRMSIRGR